MNLPIVTPPTIAICASHLRFPLRRVYCVGQNYADHTREMGGDPQREAPFFFSKPADAVVAAQGRIPYPPQTRNLHHEVELAVAIGLGGSDIAAGQALQHIWGYAVGVDLTRRDLQAEARKAGRPWDMAKAFDFSAPCTPLAPVSECGHPAAGRIWLSVNGQIRHDGDLNQMIWSVPEIIAALSRFVRLEAGDLILTGTPSGIGALAPGDVVTGGVDGVGEFSFTMAS